ncbi:HAMP domain-containing sensor histidine kinase [Paraburkholderia sp. JHI2823]|uniref:sensor histidine kinase n=1 Tax=Paraburkholderia TaxID=1822464 RepID=UPI0003FEC725|nr:HAMP domain-containing sensor histidine kinase [Paraburkholderia mimosarum]
MRLADFMVCNTEAILAQWEASVVPVTGAAASAEWTVLRDSARQILQTVAKQISVPQTKDAQQEQSRRRLSRTVDDAGEMTAAQTLALMRAQRGFSINQMALDYRALRASVLRLWADKARPDALDLDDIIRFDEAMDQALADSVAFFNKEVEQARNLLLGMLGHDMRSPLQTIVTTASHLAALNAGESVSDAASRLIRSGARMQSLLEDLCDFNRTKLGLGIKIDPHDVDLAEVLIDVIDQLRAVHSDRRIDVEAKGNLHGTWDGRRIQQLLGNLVVNAIKYGAPDTSVRVLVTGTDDEVRVEVWNRGPAIDGTTMEYMFKPLQRGLHEPARPRDSGGLGLGLYIATEIAKAHHGEIRAQSDETQTIFSVRLPRRNYE